MKSYLTVLLEACSSLASNPASYHFVQFLLFWQVDIPDRGAHRDPMFVQHFRYNFLHFRVVRIKIEHVTDNIGQALVGESLEEENNDTIKR